MPARVTIDTSTRGIFDLEGMDRPGLAFWWLGQAGFAVQVLGTRILIDPYLSDSLAKKYAGTEFPHRRMMPVPAEPQDFADIAFVLCTHSHSDHMDPGTLPGLLGSNPRCRIVVPRATLDHASTLGLDEAALVPINAGDHLDIAEGISLKAVAAAHEEIRVDEDGNHHYLGYVLSTPWLRLYHSGDCVPYNGLDGVIQREHIDIALLPVNGRDEFRTSRGILGNFTIPEAVELCHDAKIPALVAHHFGLFDFNTVSREALENSAREAPAGLQFIIPEMGVRYDLEMSTPCR